MAAGAAVGAAIGAAGTAAGAAGAAAGAALGTAGLGTAGLGAGGTAAAGIFSAIAGFGGFAGSYFRSNDIKSDCPILESKSKLPVIICSEDGQCLHCE